MRKIKTVIPLCLLLTISSCNWWNKAQEEKNPFEGISAKELYTESQHLLGRKQYEQAAKRLEAIETMYPFSEYTEESQKDLMYAYFENEDYPSAAATAERFIHLYPRALHVDYAYYLKGMANFHQARGNMSKFFPMDEAWRDPGSQVEAYADFTSLIQRFPDSIYKPSALQHLIYLRNNLALHELHISQYYLERKLYVAAIERAHFLVQNYSEAPCVRAAFKVLYDSNRALGLNEAADDIMKIYQANYHTDVMLG